MPDRQRALAISLDTGARVTGLLDAPANAQACYVFAHGAGAGMNHSFMTAIATGLAERGKPSTERAKHLLDVRLPMLFLQGTRDALARLDLMRATTATLGNLATLHVIDGADHAFHVLVRSGRNDAQVREELLDTMSAWMKLS